MRFSKALRDEAVELAPSSGKRREQFATQMGIGKTSLQRWVATSAWGTQGSFVVNGLTPQQVLRASNDHPSGLPSPPLDAAYLTDENGNVTLFGDTLLSADIAE